MIILNDLITKKQILAKTANHNDGKSFVKEAKIVVPLKYFNNFWRSREMPLINCKVYLELNWIEDCILSSDGYSAKFAIKDAKLHVAIITFLLKTVKNWKNNEAKDVKDVFIGIVMKQNPQL